MSARPIIGSRFDSPDGATVHIESDGFDGWRVVMMRDGSRTTSATGNAGEAVETFLVFVRRTMTGAG